MSFLVFAGAVGATLQVLRWTIDFAQASTGPFSLSVGVRRQGDLLLYEEQQHPHPTMGYQSHVFSYNGGPNVRITRVDACDNKRTGTGGSPKIISGGVGYGHVEVEVTSKFGKSFDHTIYVYGYYVQ